MLIRAAFGMAVAMFCMGLVTNVWELIALRACKDCFPATSPTHKP